MKWWCIHILIWLTLGIISTVAVSWTAVYMNYGKYKYEREKAWWIDKDRPLKWTTIVDRDYWYSRVTYMFHDYNSNPDEFVNFSNSIRSQNRRQEHPVEMLPYWASHLYSDKADIWTDSETAYTHGVIATGWPLRALKYERYGAFVDSKVQEVYGEFRIDLGREKISGRMTYILLPLIPVWPGFIFNVILYSTPWIFIFGGYSSTKRVIRRRRGKCPKCAYDLRGDFESGCSECGWNREENVATKDPMQESTVKGQVEQ